jgi:hypothetical protein
VNLTEEQLEVIREFRDFNLKYEKRSRHKKWTCTFMTEEPRYHIGMGDTPDDAVANAIDRWRREADEMQVVVWDSLEPFAPSTDA